jgi:hypothetical protein
MKRKPFNRSQKYMLGWLDLHVDVHKRGKFFCVRRQFLAIDTATGHT